MRAAFEKLRLTWAQGDVGTEPQVAPVDSTNVAQVLDTSTPVLILGGKENSLSLVRQFGRLGIDVRASGPVDCWAMFSRHCTKRYFIPHGTSPGKFWKKMLLGDGRNPELANHIIFPCCDDSINFVAGNQSDLEKHYTLDGVESDCRLEMLNKTRTLELAAQAGLDVPQFLTVTPDMSLETLRDKVRFPVMLKPIHTHSFARVFGKKLFIIDTNFDDLAEKICLVRSHNFKFMLVDMIPGPDSALSSYYTYVDGAGRYMFDFTKKVIRRYPVNRGSGCYHATEWLPETAELGKKFFEHIGFRGFGNIEFKRDPRDGKLKIIEVNARFTAAHELALRSGAPLDLIVYCALTGQAGRPFRSYTDAVRMWYPFRDFLAFLELRSRGELTLWGWIKSIYPFVHIHPLYDIRDPLPTLGASVALIEKIVRGR